MIEFSDGDLFESDCDALLNTVNVVGVMGKGLALQFAKRFPSIVPPYKKACREGLAVGKLHILWFDGNPKAIVNFPTKEHWRNPSKIEYVQAGLAALGDWLRKHEEIQSVAIPALGCSNGGLDWNVVRLEIEKFCEEFPERRFVVFPPQG